jgi:hypothetical protein
VCPENDMIGDVWFELLHNKSELSPRPKITVTSPSTKG